MKINITIDVTKIPKERIVERRYTNTQGHEVIAKDLKLDVVPLKEPKLIKDGGTWQLWKTHFVCFSSTKEERENNVKSVIIGDGISFKDKSSDVINPEEVPF